MCVSIVDYMLIEIIHDMGADEHGFNILLHHIKIIALGVSALGQFSHQLLLTTDILHIVGVPHSSL